MVDLTPWVLGFLIADCVFWALTLWRVFSLERVARPLIAVVEPWLKPRSKPEIPPGAYGASGAPSAQGPTPPAGTALAPLRKQFTSRGRLITTERGADGKWRIVSNTAMPAGATGSESNPNGGVDLNALARRFGFEPEQVAQMVDQYAGGEGGPQLREIPPELAAKVPGLGGVPEQLVSKLLTGDLSQQDAALAAPMIIRALRDANARAKNGQNAGGGTSSSDRW